MAGQQSHTRPSDQTPGDRGCSQGNGARGIAGLYPDRHRPVDGQRCLDAASFASLRTSVGFGFTPAALSCDWMRSTISRSDVPVTSMGTAARLGDT